MRVLFNLSYYYYCYYYDDDDDDDGYVHSCVHVCVLRYRTIITVNTLFVLKFFVCYYIGQQVSMCFLFNSQGGTGGPDPPEK